MLLIDGDIMLYNSIHKTVINVEFDDEWHGPWLDVVQAKARIDLYIKGLREKLDADGEHDVVVAWSDHEGCFRKGVDPSYKQSRTGHKPAGWFELEEYVSKVYQTERMPMVEADDVLGILATKHVGSIIVSDDKDLMTIPGKLYRPRQAQLMTSTVRDADLYHLRQTLEGDKVDDYPGCPRVGAVTAQRVLEPCLEAPQWNRKARLQAWDITVKTFEKNGKTAEDALIQAQLARILRKTEWDFKKQEVVLWQPGR